MNELKPCPVCGGKGIVQAIDFYPDYSDPPIWWVACETCGAHTDEFEGETEAEAVEAWNTRAERTCRYDDGWCSECEHFLHIGFNWCPWCGAKVVKD